MGHKQLAFGSNVLSGGVSQDACYILLCRYGIVDRSGSLERPNLLPLLPH